MKIEEYRRLTGQSKPAKVAKPRQSSKLEAELWQQIQLAGLPEPETEYRFLADRRFRFDFAYPALKIAVEVEGGTWTGGRHTSGKGFENDCKKYNLATMNGWQLLRYTSDMISDGSAVNDLQQMLEKN